MYQIPLRYIKISKDVAICATRIIAIMSTNIYQARRTIKDEKTKGTLINGAGIQKAETAIFLDNGTVISSPYKIERLMKAIEQSNIKSIKNRDMNEKRLKVYDVSDEEPDEDDVEYEEATSENEDVDYENITLEGLLNDTN